MELMKVSKGTKKTVAIVIWILALLWLVPFISLFQKTLLGEGLRNYKYVLSNKINGIFLPMTYINSFIIAFCTTILTTLMIRIKMNH